MSDMLSLLAAIEAADGPRCELDDQIFSFVDTKVVLLEDPSYTASIDAAVALIEAVLPGAYWRVGKKRPGRISATYIEIPISDDPNEESIGTIFAGDYAKTPALALCAALIRAMIAKEEKPHV